MTFTNAQIAALRERIESSMSAFRFAHTAGVEQMVLRLGALYMPEDSDVLQVAALLHDITKEKKTDEQLMLLRTHGQAAGEAERLSPKTLHAKTAALLIPELYGEFADERVIRAVRLHTTLAADMTLADKLLYLADYIDETRNFDDCVRLRELFWSADVEAMSAEERLAHLNRIILISLDMTISSLIDEGAVISPETVEARNEIIRTLGA